MEQRLYQQGRLVYYRAAADSHFWDAHWQQQTTIIYKGAYQGYFDPAFEATLMRFLPRDGKILEAGCGMGQVVLTLRVRGYDAEGVEWGEKTVEYVNTHLPDLPVRQGDVTALAVVDGHYAGYVSLGVVEHRQAGPDPFLKEAHRILRPGGIACISVPYLHPLRRWKAHLGFYRGQHNPHLEFYQYAFTRSEFVSILQQHGFRILQVTPYGGYKGIKDEMPFIQTLFRWRGGWRVKRWLEQSARIEAVFGHMLMVVCEKTA
jgi:SAM-dependent methyltransferase